MGKLSDDENEQVYQFKKMQRRNRRGAGPARKFRQQIDTNVFKIALKTLKDKAEIATGDPTICTNCQAIFNKTSQITEPEPDKQIWKCEFCLHEN